MQIDESLPGVASLVTEAPAVAMCPKCWHEYPIASEGPEDCPYCSDPPRAGLPRMPIGLRLTKWVAAAVLCVALFALVALLAILGGVGDLRLKSTPVSMRGSQQLGPVMLVIAIPLAVAMVAGLTGWAIAKAKPWGRYLAIVFWSVLFLPGLNDGLDLNAARSVVLVLVAFWYFLRSDGVVAYYRSIGALAIRAD